MATQLGARHIRLAKRDIQLVFESMKLSLDEAALLEAHLGNGNLPEAVQAVYFMAEMLARAEKTIVLAKQSTEASLHEVARAHAHYDALQAAYLPDSEEDGSDEEPGPTNH